MSKKSYTKFVAGTITTAMVAGVVAPVTALASTTFSDVPAGSYAVTAINYGVEQGYIHGMSETVFGYGQDITRQDAAVIIASAVAGSSDAVPEVTTSSFVDVDTDGYANKFIEALVAKGIVGDGEGHFNPKDAITRAEFSQMVVQAFGFTIEDGATVPEFTDTVAGAWYENAITILSTKVAISGYPDGSFQPNANIAREAAAQIIYGVHHKEEVGAMQAEATGVDTLTVTFDSAVTDTEAVKFEVLKGNNAATYSNVSWNETKTVATLEMDADFGTATYTVNVTGVSEGALTDSFEAKAEAPVAIEIAPYLVLESEDTTTSGGAIEHYEATTNFKVVNQYGEIYSKPLTTSFLEADLKTIDTEKLSKWSDSDYTVDFDGNGEGTVTFALEEDVDVDDVGTLVLTYEDDNKDIDLKSSKEVVVSDPAVVSEVEVSGLYNDYSDGFVETVNSNDAEKNDRYYLAVKASSQYGTTLVDDDKIAKFVDEIKVDSSDDDILDLKLGTKDSSEVTFRTVEGVNYYFIPVTREKNSDEFGNVDLSVEARETNNESVKSFELVQSSTPSKVTLSPSNQVIANGETISVAAEVLDQNGEVITDVQKLNDWVGTDNGEFIDIGITDNQKVTINTGIFVKIDGKIYYELELEEDNSAKENYDVEVNFDVEDGEETEYIFNIEYEKAVASDLVSVTPITLFNGRTEDITFEDFVVKDQYGRVMRDGNLNVKTEGATIATTTERSIIVKPSTSADLFTIENISTDTKNINGSDISLGAASNLAGSQTFTFELTDGTKVIDTVTSTFRLINDVDVFDSFTAVAENDLYANGEDDTLIKVYGMLGNKKVRLPQSVYGLANGSSNLTKTTSSSNVISATDKTDDDTDVNTESTVYVTINKNGQQVSVPVVVKDADPVAEYIGFYDNIDEISVKEITVTADIAGLSVAKLIADHGVIGTDNEIITFTTEGEDQYGNELKGATDATNYANTGVTVTNVYDSVPSSEAVISGNGTSGFNITNLESGSSFTAEFTLGNAKTTVRVKVK